MYPVALEAVLRAKVALFTQLLAVRTLQRSCVVLTICARALSWGVCGHDARGIRTMEMCARVEGDSWGALGELVSYMGPPTTSH
jgi:hypothetical protein